MTACRRTRSVLPLVAGIALLALSLGASAREVRLQGPNGEGGTCPTAALEGDAVASPAPARRPASAAKAEKKTSPITRGGGDAADASTRPRWHSFLPGMFR